MSLAFKSAFNSFRAKRAAQVLKAGGVVAYPTEAVWGLGCDPFNDAAVQRLLDLKQRDVAKGLILIAADIQQFSPFLSDLHSPLLQRLQQSWPSPVTWLVPDNGCAPQWIRGRFSTVALRVSSHPAVIDLCIAFGGPIVSSSANPQGLAESRTLFTLQRYFGGGIDAIMPGALGDRDKPSEIRDLLTNTVLRHA